MNIAMTERGASTAQLLKDKVSLVTGSTSGIGLGIARALAASGSAVVLNGFGKPEEIEATQAAIIPDFGVKVAYSGTDELGIAVFLCSDVAASITGAAIPVDGGWTAH